MNTVAPGPIPTELFLKGKSEERIEEFRKMSPLERLGQPEDIAGVVSFLSGPDGGWVNGQVVRANGHKATSMMIPRIEIVHPRLMRTQLPTSRMPSMRRTLKAVWVVHFIRGSS